MAALDMLIQLINLVLKTALQALPHYTFPRPFSMQLGHLRPN